MKLAICEDNPVHYNMIHTLLKKYLKDSFEVTHFTSGDEFFRVVEAEGCPYSIVLTDIDLGSDDLNGISLADKINHLSPDAQIIFISQYLQYATAVYETEHAYFIHKQQLEEYLPLALKAACRRLEKFPEIHVIIRCSVQIFFIWNVICGRLRFIPNPELIQPKRN